MQTLNFDYKNKLFEKSIQLYGDRAGGQGNFDFAGLAELESMKFVLLIGNLHSLEQPTDWRRFIRLLKLADRIHKPVLLWNLQLIQIASRNNHISLELSNTINNTRMQLLQLSKPVISVFDETIEFDNAVKGLSWSDGTIVISSDEPEDRKGKRVKWNNLYYVDTTSAIPNKISEIMQEHTGKTKKEILERRIEVLQNLSTNGSNDN